MQSKANILWLMAVLVIAIGTAPARAQATKPEELLSSRHELHRVPSSTVWITRLEQDLRALWQEMPQHRDAIVLLEQSLNERIERNRRDWLVAVRTEDSLRAALANMARSDSQRSQFERQLSTLRQGTTAPDRLGNVEDVRAQLIQLADHRHSLWLNAQAIRQKTSMLDDSYSQLRQSTEVSALLKKLGSKHRLGPARNYGEDLTKLTELERPALTNWAPLYRVGDHLRISLLANHSTPLTFTWTSSPEPTLITATMAEAIGVQAHADAKPQTVSMGQRTWRARPAVIPYLQLGKFELREVEVAILPPDAEAMGARIGPNAFKGFRPELEPTRLRLGLSPMTELAQ